MKKDEVIHLRVTKKFKERIQQTAKENGLTISDLVIAAIHEYLQRQEPPNKGREEKEA